MDDVGAGVGDGCEKAEQKAWDDALTIRFAFCTEQDHGDGGDTGCGEHPRGEGFAGKEEREECDEDDLGSEDGCGEGDIAAAQGEEGENLSDEEDGTGEGCVKKIAPTERVASEQEPGLEEDSHHQVDDKSGAPR